MNNYENYELRRCREVAVLLRKVGYELESNQDGYKVTYKGAFVCAAGVALPRRKPLHWRHAEANRRDFFINAVQSAEKHAKENKVTL